MDNSSREVVKIETDRPFSFGSCLSRFDCGAWRICDGDVKRAERSSRRVARAKMRECLSWRLARELRLSRKRGRASANLEL